MLTVAIFKAIQDDASILSTLKERKKTKDESAHTFAASRISRRAARRQNRKRHASVSWYNRKTTCVPQQKMSKDHSSCFPLVETKKAMYQMRGSIQAVIDFMSREADIISDENLRDLSENFLNGRYVCVLQHAYKYARNSYAKQKLTWLSGHEHERVNQRDPSEEVIMFLLVVAWESLAQYDSRQYQHAKRHDVEFRPQKSTSSEKKTALERREELAKLCLACQCGLQRAQKRHQSLTQAPA